MKLSIGGVFIVGLILINVVSCSLGTSLAQNDIETNPTQLPITNQAIVAATSTQLATENMLIGGTQVKFSLDDRSTEDVSLAKQDLARRLGVPVDSITVSAVIGQEFSTDAFNCRPTKERINKEEPLQIISGVSILLNVSARRYEYHARGQIVIFCRSLP